MFRKHSHQWCEAKQTKVSATWRDHLITTGCTQNKVYVYLHGVAANEQVHQNLQLQLSKVLEWRSAIQGKDGMWDHSIVVEVAKVGKEMVLHELIGMDPPAEAKLSCLHPRKPHRHVLQLRDHIVMLRPLASPAQLQWRQTMNMLLPHQDKPPTWMMCICGKMVLSFSSITSILTCLPQSNIGTTNLQLHLLPT